MGTGKRLTAEAIEDCVQRSSLGSVSREAALACVQMLCKALIPEECLCLVQASTEAGSHQSTPHCPQSYKCSMSACLPDSHGKGTVDCSVDQTVSLLYSRQ